MVGRPFARLLGELPLRLVNPAEVTAASYCWLARWNTRPAAMGETFRQIDSYYHPSQCRFCDVPLDELMRRIKLDGDPMDPTGKAPRAAAWNTLKALPRKAQLQRIREAQERDWWDGLDEPAVDKRAAASGG